VSFSAAAYTAAQIGYRIGKGVLVGNKGPRNFNDKIVRKEFGHLIPVKKARKQVREAIEAVMASDLPEEQKSQEIDRLEDALFELRFAHETGGELSWIDVKVVEPARRVLRGVLLGTVVIGSSMTYCNRHDISAVAKDVPVESAKDTFQDSIDETTESIKDWEKRGSEIKDRLFVNSIKFFSILSSNNGAELRDVFGDAVGMEIGERFLAGPIREMFESWGGKKEKDSNPVTSKPESKNLEELFDTEKSPFKSMLKAIEKNQRLNPVFQQIKSDLFKLRDIGKEVIKLVEKNSDLMTYAERLKWNLRSNFVENIERAYNNPSRLVTDNSEEDKPKSTPESTDTSEGTKE